MRLVSIDGSIVPPERATVSVFDRGFLFGDAVFEVLRTYGGVPFALEEHLARLERSCELVFIRMPVSAKELEQEIGAAIHEAANPESYVRIIVTRGQGPIGLDPDLAGAPLRVVIVEPLNPPPRAAYADGIGLVTVSTKRAVDETGAVGAKVSNYLANLLALREAKRRGAQEALVVDSKGVVVEGASSNVFVVRAAPPEGGRATLLTPPESAGILVGITRAHVLAVAAKLGLRVVLASLTPAEVYAADEVFITSSIREILPVVRIDGRVIGRGVPGPICRAVHAAFRERVGMGGRPMPWDPPPA
jgi:branched-chain amino acid aminotransferase